MLGRLLLEILRGVHRVDRVLDRSRLRRKSGLRLIPNADDEERVEGKRVALHQRRDFSLLLLHYREQRELLLARIVARNALVRLLLSHDLFADRDRIDVHRDGVVEQPQIGEPVNDSGERHLRPPRQRDDGVVMPVHPETEILLAVPLAVPAVLLNREQRIERLQRVVVEPFRERWIQECRVVPVMLGVRHRKDARALAAENAGERFVNLRELLLKLVEQKVVVLREARTRPGERRGSLDLPRDVEDEPLPTQPAIDHRLPVARKAFVARASRPDVRGALGLFVVAEQLVLIVGIAEPLHLEPLVVAERSEQDR